MGLKLLVGNVLLKPNSSERAERDRREKNVARGKAEDERFSEFEGGESEQSLSRLEDVELLGLLSYSVGNYGGQAPLIHVNIIE